MKALLVVPTYNERENIQELVAEIRRTPLPVRPEILVVDSNSPDATADAVEALGRTDPELHLLRQHAKLGLGRAYQDGMAWALQREYDCLVTMDADFSHHPRYLIPMLDAAASADLVIGSRYVSGGKLVSWPLRRKLLSRGANLYARLMTGLPLRDVTSGFHCFRLGLLRRVLREPIRTEGYAFLYELKLKSVLHGAVVKEIPITFNDRTRGASKISQRVMWESMLYVLKCSALRGRVAAAAAKARGGPPAFPFAG